MSSKHWLAAYGGRIPAEINADAHASVLAMLEEAMKTNYGIYDVLLGKQKPFVFDDPRFKNTK